MRYQVIEYVGLVGQHRRNSRQEDNSGLQNRYPKDSCWAIYENYPINATFSESFNRNSGGPVRNIRTKKIPAARISPCGRNRNLCTDGISRVLYSDGRSLYH